MKRIDSEILSQKWGRLEPLEIFVMSKNGKNETIVKCKCDCGSYVDVLLYSLKSGNTLSCGCYNKERAREANLVHGLRSHLLYNVWKDMNGRCKREKHHAYKDYGGRGIKVCDEWQTAFKCFYDWCLENGWEEGLCIDRENNDGNYEPLNCRFVTYFENNLNRRLIRKSNKSGYAGVSYNKESGRYRAKINYKYKVLLDSTIFKTAKEAAIARDNYIIENNLPMKLNFIDLRS